MLPPSWMLVRLEIETRAHIAAADADRLVLMEHTTPSRYRAFLARIYGFEAPVEEAVARTPGLDTAVVADLCNHAPKLRADLRGLGLTESSIGLLPRCPLIPTFRNVGCVLGWLYVLERNRMVHGVIRRQLATAMPGEIQHASSYLATHDGVAGSRMRRLGAILDASARATAFVPGQIVRAAHDAFRTQRHWFTSPARRDTLAFVS